MREYLVACEYGGIATTADLHEAFEIMYNDPDANIIVDANTYEVIAEKE